MGTGGAAGGDDADYDPDADLSGELSVMGFSGVDEIATSRVEYAEAELGDVEVEARSRATSTSSSSSRPWHPASRPSSSTPTATRSASLRRPRRHHPARALHRRRGHRHRTSSASRRVDQVTLDGKVYGIPEFNEVQITMANADLLSAAGVTIEDVNGSDWEAMSAGQQGAHEGRRRLAQRHRLRLQAARVPPALGRSRRRVDLLSDGRPDRAARLAGGRRGARRGRSASTTTGRLQRRSRRSATPPTSSARATSSRRTRSARCRWSSGTSTS